MVVDLPIINSFISPFLNVLLEEFRFYFLTSNPVEMKNFLFFVIELY